MPPRNANDEYNENLANQAEGKIGTHARATFQEGARAVLPQAVDETGLLALSGGQGDLPEHKHDRFARYDSMTAFLASCENPVKVNTDDSGQEITPDKKRSGYEGTADFAKALRDGPHIDPAWEGMETPLSFADLKRFLLAGWNEGATLIRDAIAQVEPPPAMDIRRKGVWADQGDALSTDRLQAGAYETAWRTTRKRMTFALQRVRIAVDLGSTCSACGTVGHNARYLHSRALFWRGAAAASLCESLEAAGYRVEIVACCGIGNSALNYPDTRVTLDMLKFQADPLTMGWIRAASQMSSSANTSGIAVVVKDFDAPVDIATIAAGTASAAMYRRCMFLSHVANALPGEGVARQFGAMLDVQQSPRMRRELGIDEEGVATLFVGQWVLTQKLANAWAKGALYGIESHRTGYTEEDMNLEGGPQ